MNRQRIWVSIAIVGLWLALPARVDAAPPYIAGELRTNASFMHGRFTLRFKSAQGSGLVSSMFLFNDANFTVPQWNEVKAQLGGAR